VLEIRSGGRKVPSVRGVETGLYDVLEQTKAPYGFLPWKWVLRIKAERGDYERGGF